MVLESTAPVAGTTLTDKQVVSGLCLIQQFVFDVFSHLRQGTWLLAEQYSPPEARQFGHQVSQRW